MLLVVVVRDSFTGHQILTLGVIQLGLDGDTNLQINISPNPFNCCCFVFVINLVINH